VIMSNTVTIEGKEYTITLTPVEPKPVKPKYAMTAADWERVCDEKFYCVFFDTTGCVQGKLLHPPSGTHIRLRDDRGVYWNNCEVQREIGHRQPHFGGTYPGHPKDKIIYKTLKGWGGITLASSLYWDKTGSGADQITEYIVIEEGGK
jgi:hypothetical protein